MNAPLPRPAGAATVVAAPPLWLDESVAELAEVRLGWRERHRDLRAVRCFPSTAALERVLALIAASFYPQRLGGWHDEAREDDFVRTSLIEALALLREQIGNEVAYWQAEARTAFDDDLPASIVGHFAAGLADARRLIDSDVEAAFLGDPAARSVDEILACYPGAIASLHHRIAHPLHRLGAPIVARLISELANRRTGIDVHPGATIGPSFFIDHGTGVVIGETAIVGARVRLYQHVTLGARSPLGLSQVSPRERFARHPIVEDDVVIYAGATILGRVTIGRGSIIGGNVWLLDDVAPGSVVVPPAPTILGGAIAEEMRQSLVQGSS